MIANAIRSSVLLIVGMVVGFGLGGWWFGGGTQERSAKTSARAAVSERETRDRSPPLDDRRRESSDLSAAVVSAAETAVLSPVVDRATLETADLEWEHTLQATLASLEVRVLDSFGVPVETATIVDRRTSRSWPWTARSPLLRLQAGAYALRASDGKGGVSDPHHVEVDCTEIPRILTMSLCRRSTIRGIVETGDWDWHQSYDIVCLPVADDEATMRTRAVGSLPSLTRQSLTAQRRWYEFTGLRDGTYLLAVLRDRELVDERVVTVAGGAERIDFMVPPLPDDELLWVTVSDDRGGPVNDAHVSLKSRVTNSGGVSVGWHGPHSRTGNTYVFRLADRVLEYLAGRCEGETTLEVSANGTSVERMVRPGGPRHWSVRLPVAKPGVEVQISIVGEQVSAALHLLSVELSNEELRSSRNSLRDDGGVTFRDVHPGRYLVSLHTSLAGFPGSMEIAHRELNVDASGAHVTLPMPPLRPLTIDFPKPVHWWMQIQRQDTGAEPKRLERTDTAPIRELTLDLPPGVYRFGPDQQRHSTNSRLMTIVHRGPTRVVYRPDPEQAPR